MLTRLEIDNFRCFEGFVWEPARKQLILGANGCGKSSMMDALTKLRLLVAGEETADRLFPFRERTRWRKDAPDQTFSIQAVIDKVPYRYQLVVGPFGDQLKPAVVLETLDCANGALLVDFDRGVVTVRHAEGVYSYELDARRSALSSLGESEATKLAIQFRRWLPSFYCFRLNPFNMSGLAEGEDSVPKPDLSNFAAWYRHVSLGSPKRASALLKTLDRVLDGFDVLSLQEAGEGARSLNAEFKRADGSLIRFLFNELSEGQRCLICLYTVLYFLVAEGRTVIVDEPESFIGLRELQPWLMTATQMVSDAEGQLILISHNPELIDQWAPPHGIRFVRDGVAAVKVEPWHGEPDSGLSPAELIARGWDDA